MAEEENLEKTTQRSNKKSYDRKAVGGRDEEFDYDMFKRKQFEKMDNRNKHLLTYSNVNSQNFVDINKEDNARAWNILFHFKGKSLDSLIFEDFNSIVQRNTIGKTKNHDFFQKIYLRLSEEAYKRNYTIKTAEACE